MNTYSTKSNAARAAKRSGIEICENNLYEINGRYVYLDKQPNIPEEHEKGVAGVSEDKQPKNKRPKGKIVSLCWDLFDSISNTGGEVSAAMLKNIHETKGINLTTLRCQRTAWRKFNSLEKDKGAS